MPGGEQSLQIWPTLSQKLWRCAYERKAGSSALYRKCYKYLWTRIQKLESISPPSLRLMPALWEIPPSQTKNLATVKLSPSLVNISLIICPDSRGQVADSTKRRSTQVQLITGVIITSTMFKQRTGSLSQLRETKWYVWNWEWLM